METIWPLLARKYDPSSSLARLKDHFSIISNVSGLISGFVFVVTNSSVQWKYEGYLGDELRTNCFGFCTVLSLILSLTATLMSIIYYGWMNVIGEHYEMINEMVQRHDKLINLPLALMMVAVTLMFVGASFAVGGLYGAIVYWAYIVIALLCVISVIIFFAFGNIDYKARYIAKLKKMDDYKERAGAQNNDQTNNIELM
eukprot:229134_1